MSIGVSGSNPAYSLNSVLQAQLALFTDVNQASSGKRITSAAVDPSGLAIYNNLSSQAQGADTANGNIADATNAINVAQGATSTIQSSLSQVNNLAIEANNGFNSATDNAALQAQANQLVQQINTVASGTNFNGTPLLDGTNSGNTPATAASAVVTANPAVASGGNLVTSATASALTQGGTIGIQVVNGSGAQLTFTDSATGAVTVIGSVSAGSTTNVNGTNVTVGNFSANDVGVNANVQTYASVPGSANPTITVQSGANQGQTTNVSLPNATSSGLGIQNVDLSNPNTATNLEGQISAAQTSINRDNAQLGAQSASLAAASDNNNVVSNNLTASASAIGDAQPGQVANGINQSNLQTQISFAVLARANTDAGHLNSFLSQYV